MHKVIKIKPRPISQGEAAQLKRLQQWAARHPLNTTKPNRNTMAQKPSMGPYGSVHEWAQQND